MKQIILAFFLFLALVSVSTPQVVLLDQTNVIRYTGKTEYNLVDLLSINDVLVIQRGTGGRLDQMDDVISYLATNPNKRIVIDGDCYSSCTLLASVPTTTLTKNARLHFHSASRNQCVEGELRSQMSLMANLMMMSQFDSNIQDWIISSKAFATTDFVTMPNYKMRELFDNQFVEAYISTGDLMSVVMHYPISNPC